MQALHIMICRAEYCCMAGADALLVRSITWCWDQVLISVHREAAEVSVSMCAVVQIC